MAALLKDIIIEVLIREKRLNGAATIQYRRKSAKRIDAERTTVERINLLLFNNVRRETWPFPSLRVKKEYGGKTLERNYVEARANLSAKLSVQ